MTAAAEAESRPDALETIIEAERFQNVVDVLRSVDDECIFNLGREGLSVSLVEPSQAYMVDIDVAASAFEHVGEGSYAIGVDLDRLDDLLGKADADDLVHFVLDLETRKFAIEFDNIDYEMAGIDPSTIREEPDVPTLDHDAEFEVEARHLQRAEDICALVSDHADLVSDPDEECIRFEARGDLDDTDVRLDEELDFAHADHDGRSEACLAIGSGGNGAGSSPGFLRDALSVIPSDVTVHCELGDDLPLIMRWEFDDCDISVTQFVAPRIKKD